MGPPKWLGLCGGNSKKEFPKKKPSEFHQWLKFITSTNSPAYKLEFWARRFPTPTFLTHKEEVKEEVWLKFKVNCEPKKVFNVASSASRNHRQDCILFTF